MDSSWSENFLVFFLALGIFYLIVRRCSREKKDVYIFALLPNKMHEFIDFCRSEELTLKKISSESEIQLILTQDEFEICCCHDAVRSGIYMLGDSRESSVGSIHF